MAWSRRTLSVEPGATLRAATPRTEWGRSRFNGMLPWDPAARCSRTEARAFLNTSQTASGPMRGTGEVTSLLCPLVTLVALTWFVG